MVIPPAAGDDETEPPPGGSENDSDAARSPTVIVPAFGSEGETGESVGQPVSNSAAIAIAKAEMVVRMRDFGV